MHPDPTHFPVLYSCSLSPTKKKSILKKKENHFTSPYFLFLHHMSSALKALGAAVCRALYTLDKQPSLRMFIAMICWYDSKPLTYDTPFILAPSSKLFSNILLLPKVMKIQVVWFHRTEITSWTSAGHRYGMCWGGSIQILECGFG